jgi:RND family efflux transporter MFP subunit
MPVAAAEELTCLLAPSELVSLASSIDGVISETFVERGTWVKRGAPIAQLDSAIQTISLERAVARANANGSILLRQAELEQNEGKLARALVSHSKGLITDEQLEELKGAAEIAKQALVVAQQELALAALDVELAKRELALTQVVSPIDGVVVQRLISTGEFSSVQNPIATIASLDPLFAEITLPADEFAKFVVGDKAIIRAGSAEVEASIVLVDALVDAASRSFGVRLAVRNRGAALPSGLRCEVIEWLQ